MFNEISLEILFRILSSINQLRKYSKDFEMMKNKSYLKNASVIKILNSKTITFIILYVLFIWNMSKPYLKFVIEKGEGMTWCIFPFLMTSYYLIGMFYFGIIYINSDVPFMQYENLYQVIRTGRKRWALYQLTGIFIRSVFITFAVVIGSIIPFIGHLLISNDWGKVAYTLANTRRLDGFYKENMVMFRFYPEAVMKFTPVKLMLVTMLICMLITTLIGVLIYFISLYLGKIMAVSLSFASVILLYVVENTMPAARLAAAKLVPFYWIEVALMHTKNNGYTRLPSLGYMITVLIVVIAILSLLIYRKIMKMEFYWENEDA